MVAVVLGGDGLVTWGSGLEGVFRLVDLVGDMAG